ncbi:8-amino-7-oxononanoate synthase [Emcibacter sp.]|uniref:8-amino-7-oxononanoate synthase n=1 Tax=Emcibacter sp. TaxID=1979954 RepID=UPI002AA821BE|nr:8-amino-7-oxononanoate synthase [Emcibacter sp.]
MKSLEKFVSTKLDKLEQAGLRRRLVTTTRLDNGHALRNGRELISFCCNDYLNMSQHPDVKQAAIEAIHEYGVGAGASRLITGNHPLLEELEAKLARLKGTEAACVFSSGYMANIGIIPSLVGPEDVIFADELSHNCLLAGSQLSGAKLIIFPHNNLDRLEDLIRQNRAEHRYAMVLTDGVFSMDGDLAPLPELSDLARHHDCWLLSDDAHGVGVIGEGRGSSFCFDRKPDIPLQMGTLSKAIGSFGGYLCASQAVVDFMKTRARSLIYTTGSPPASIAAAIKALDLIENDRDYCDRPMYNARLFAREAGLPEPQSPIIPVITGDSGRTMHLAAILEELGFLVTGIRPPTVPEGAARLRITFSAAHREEDVLALVDALRKIGALETKGSDE